MTPKGRPSRTEVIGVLALATAALALRFVHLDWSLPAIEEEALPTKKAFGMWGWETGTFQLDPETAGWPSLSFYVHLLWQFVYYGWGRLTGDFAGPLDFWVSQQLDPTPLMLWSRGLSAVVSTVPVVVAWFWARRFGLSAPGAALAALLVGISPVMVRHAQMIEPDALVTMLAALAMLALPRVLTRGSTRDYVVVAILAGLGAASKYTPVLLCVSIYVLHLVRLRREGRSLAALGLDDARLGWAALASVLTFCVASPYTFANLEVLRRDLAYQLMHMSAGHFGHAEQGVGYIHYLTRVLPRALGWPAFALSIAGLVVMTRRRGTEDIAWLAAFVPYFLVMGSLSTQFDRYMLPLVLPLAVSAAVALRAAVERWPRTTEHPVPAIAVVAVLLLAWPAQGVGRFLEAQGRTSTQQAAADWFAAQAGPDTTTVVTERYGPHLLEDPRTTDDYQPIFERLDEDQAQRLFDRPFFVYQLLPMYSARVHLTAYYYDLRHFLAYDYVVTSGAVRRRYEGEPERFPRQVEFYRDLRKYMEVAADFAPGDDHRGPRVTLHRWTEQGRRQLIREHGRPDASHYRAWTERVHAPDFLAFAEQVAVHAEREERHRQAMTYYRILGETSEPDLRPYWIERAGIAAVNADDLRRATTLFRALLERDPGNVVALGNLGFVAERTGRSDEARTWYRRCIEADTEGTASRWARRRLEAMDGGDRR
ncbi:MAG TPA: glycosyltransferase family 39 protein [Candidatus Krumholzibacteria bacterium]|nr:glycosyltransferase family 39 protein [Candidatus Krumholzibacteria bacterium]